MERGDDLHGLHGRERRILTIDVEEYFHGEAFDGSVSAGDWDYLPSRVEPAVGRLLGLLDRHDARATFFFLGWIGDRHGELVRRVAEAGHEVASRGWATDPVGALGGDEFRDVARRARELLEDLVGPSVLGHRAARPVAQSRREDFFDALIETGHLYDSSLPRLLRVEERADPDRRPTEPYVVERPGGRLLELPTSGIELRGGLRLADGGYGLRQLPYGVTRRRVRGRGTGGLVRLRSWEVDPDQPRIPLPPLGRLRHYRNLDRMPDRLERLLSDFRCTSIAEGYGLWRSSEAEPDGLPALSGIGRTAGSGGDAA